MKMGGQGMPTNEAGALVVRIVDVRGLEWDIKRRDEMGDRLSFKRC